MVGFSCFFFFFFFLQFGKAIVCSDAAAEAARYGFTAVDRPEGYLVLAVASLGEEIEEVTGTPGAEVSPCIPSPDLEAATRIYRSYALISQPICFFMESTTTRRHESWKRRRWA